MGIAAWKRFEKSALVQRNKTRLRQLIGQELRLKPTISVDTVNDGGWCYDVSILSPVSVVYSLGVGDSIDFDLALIGRCGAAIHAFDPTPGTYDTLDAATLPPQFYFHPWAVAGDDGTLTLYPRVRHNGSISEMMYTLVPDDDSKDSAIEVPAYTVASIMRQLGHDRVDVLKIDIEGAEYDVIDGVLASAHRPVQILVEFHHRHAGIGKERTVAAVENLQAAGYAIFYVSENVREVSFLLGLRK